MKTDSAVNDMVSKDYPKKNSIDTDVYKRQVNKVGGAVAGFLVDFMIIYVICMFLFSVIPSSVFDNIGLTKMCIRDRIYVYLLKHKHP